MTHQPAVSRSFQPARQSGLNTSTSGKLWVTLLVWLFYLSLVSPVFLDLGEFSLPMYRLVLLIAIIPCFFVWLFGSDLKMDDRVQFFISRDFE